MGCDRDAAGSNCPAMVRYTTQWTKMAAAASVIAAARLQLCVPHQRFSMASRFALNSFPGFHSGSVLAFATR